MHNASLHWKLPLYWVLWLFLKCAISILLDVGTFYVAWVMKGKKIKFNKVYLRIVFLWSFVPIVWGLDRWCRPLYLLLIWGYLVWYVAIFVLASKKNCFRFLFWIQWFFSWIVFVVVCIVFNGCACCEFGFFL